jgi:sugar/nucleoside kinase (ribokinase family)
MDPALPLTALGRVGTDNEGDFLLGTLGRYPNIDLSMIKREGKTSFTAVMADSVSKERTFFHYRGANALFCEDDIDWEKITPLFLHIGYVLLLDTLDMEDPVYGTKMARLLCHAKEHGKTTSLDTVSETGDRLKRLMPPSLKYTDYCIINDIEAALFTGIKLRDNEGKMIDSNVRKALEGIKNLGVSQWAVIHSPEGGYGLDGKGNFAESPAVDLPPDCIKGKVGAGDAFCAGAVYAAYQGGSLAEGLELGNAAAAASLSEPGATEGMLPVAELLKIRGRFGSTS